MGATDPRDLAVGQPSEGLAAMLTDALMCATSAWRRRDSCLLCRCLRLAWEGWSCNYQGPASHQFLSIGRLQSRGGKGLVIGLQSARQFLPGDKQLWCFEGAAPAFEGR